MMSFDEFRLGPEIVAALAAEGIETPTPFQAAAIPVIARGNDLLGRVGPGGGAMVAYAAPLLDRLEAGAGSPVCLVVCTGRREATELARSAARLCEATGHRAAALDTLWRAPERADLLFVPADGIHKLFDGTASVAGVRAAVFHDGDGIMATVPEDHVEALLAGLPDDCQRVFCGLPFGPALRSVAKRFTRRAATVPSPSWGEEDGAGGPGAKPGGSRTGRVATGRALHCVVADRRRPEAALALAAELLEGPARHVLVFASSADQAADLGDFLELHGFAAGAPGDEDAPVWLAPGEDAEAVEALEAASNPRAVATVSVAPPAGAEAAWLRHGTGGPAWVVAETRELRHVEAVTREAGLAFHRRGSRRSARVSDAMDALGRELAEAARSPEAVPYALLVEALAGELSATEIAAAALALLHSQRAAAGRPASPAPTAWVRLFLSCGESDEIGPGEIVGAITSEANVAREQIGKIQVRDRHAVVEVAEPEAAKVVKALNGITLGGRSLRADYDRAGSRRPTRSASEPHDRSARQIDHGGNRRQKARPASERDQGRSGRDQDRPRRDQDRPAQGREKARGGGRAGAKRAPAARSDGKPYWEKCHGQARPASKRPGAKSPASKRPASKSPGAKQVASKRPSAKPAARKPTADKRRSGKGAARPPAKRRS